jgi:hypothetical protein
MSTILLKSALVLESVPEILNALVEVASQWIEQDKQDEAAAVLAFALEHPNTPENSRKLAEQLWLKLESALCPRVIWDAKARAREVSLQQVVGEVLDDDVEQLNP